MKLVFSKRGWCIISLFFCLSVGLGVSEELRGRLGRVPRMVLLVLMTLFGGFMFVSVVLEVSDASFFSICVVCS